MNKKISIVFVFALLALIGCKEEKDPLKRDKSMIPKGMSKQEFGMDKWMEQNFEMTQDPKLGRVPYERLAVAQAYTNSLMNNALARTNALAWTERGPNNVGGRTRAFFIDRRDATGNTVFAGGVGGGIWKCTNFKSSNFNWVPVNDNLPNLAISAMAQDPSNPNIMYAGTGEGWFNSDAIKGYGIYKSLDGGNNWFLLAETENGGTNGDFEYVQDIVVTSTGIVFAACRSGRFCNAGGVFRSIDGGLGWSRVIGSGSTCATAFNFRGADIEIAANGDVYATTGLQSDANINTGRIFKSLASNGASIGASGTWTEITPPGISTSSTWRRIEIAIAPSNANVVYALCQRRASNAIGAIFRSDNGGTSWTAQTLPTWCNQGTNSSDFTNGQSWYDLIASVSATDENTCIIGGVDMLRTTNGGNTWAQISQWSSGCGASINNVHADIHEVKYYPGSGTELISTNDGGIYYSADGGGTWQAKNTNYNVTQFYAADLHPTNTNYFLAGAQDNGTQRFNQAGNNATLRVTGGDGAYCHIDQTNGQTQVTSYVYNNYYYSRNSGSSFTSVPGGTSTSGRFINPTEYDDAQDVLYTATKISEYGLVTNIAGPGAPVYQTVPLSDLVQTASAFKVDPNVVGGGTLWIAGSGSGNPVFVKITNAHTTTPTLVKSVVPFGFQSNSYVTSIDVKPGNSNHLLATVSNYGVPSVFESTDGGDTWTSIEGNLPDMPVRWGIYAPADGLLTSSTTPGGIILATETGVWCTSIVNGSNTNWVPQNTGLANVSCYMVKYRPSDRTLVVATHGRGLYTSNIPAMPTTVNTVLNTKGFITYVSANQSNLFIKTGTLTGIKNMQVNIIDMQGRLLVSNKLSFGSQSMPVQQLPKGTYVVKILGDRKEQYTQQFVK